MATQSALSVRSLAHMFAMTMLGVGAVYLACAVIPLNFSQVATLIFG